MDLWHSEVERTCTAECLSVLMVAEITCCNNVAYRWNVYGEEQRSEHIALWHARCTVGWWWMLRTYGDVLRPTCPVTVEQSSVNHMLMWQRWRPSAMQFQSNVQDNKQTDTRWTFLSTSHGNASPASRVSWKLCSSWWSACSLPYQTGPDFFINGVTQPSLSDDRNMPVLKDIVALFLKVPICFQSDLEKNEVKVWGTVTVKLVTVTG